MAHFYSGRDGEFSFDGNVIAKVASFTIQSNLETLETTTLGDNARTYTPGVLSYSGSATLLYYEDSGKMAAAEVLNKVFTTSLRFCATSCAARDKASVSARFCLFQ